jgi:guanosine-diphosphatase
MLAVVCQHQQTQRLCTVYPFPLAPQEPAVAIMDGRDEGVFAWVTTNYLLDTIRADSPRTAVPYAVLDLGGASTQIVFEPVFRHPGQDAAAAVTLEEGEHRYELSFGGSERMLYQHSYLGYGLMRARKRVHRLVNFLASFRTDDAGAELANPCLARGTRREVEVERSGSGSDSTRRNVTMFGADDTSSFEACSHVVDGRAARDGQEHVSCQMFPLSSSGVLWC